LAFDRAVMPGAKHVGQGQQRGQQRAVGGDGQLDQRPGSLGDADSFALTAVEVVAVLAAVAAGALQPLAAELARVVLPQEWGDD